MSQNNTTGIAASIFFEVFISSRTESMNKYNNHIYFHLIIFLLKADAHCCRCYKNINPRKCNNAHKLLFANVLLKPNIFIDSDERRLMNGAARENSRESGSIEHLKLFAISALFNQQVVFDSNAKALLWIMVNERESINWICACAELVIETHILVTQVASRAN